MSIQLLMIVLVISFLTALGVTGAWYGFTSRRPLATTVPAPSDILPENLPAPDPETYGPPTTHEVIGWIPYWDQASAMESFSSYSDQLDYLALFWYAVNEDGQIRPYPYATIDPVIISSAHDRGVKVLAVIANLPPEDEDGSWDADRLDTVLSEEEARRAHIQNIMNIVQEHNFDGVNIDYEAMRANQKRNFTRFIKELAAALHAQNKILGVSLMPKMRENDPNFTNGSEAQDWRQLGKYADHLYLMTYEEHWEESEPGSVASLPWVAGITTYARRMIPPEKIFGGIGLYGYDWPEVEGEGAQGLTFENVEALIATHSPDLEWGDRAKSWTFTYEESGTTHTVWYEDVMSFQAKHELFNQYGIGNRAFWRLGGEDERIWPLMR